MDGVVESDFLNRNSFAQDREPTTDKRELIRLKGFCSGMEVISQVERESVESERMCAAIHLTEMNMQNIYIFKNTSSNKMSKQATQFTSGNGSEQSSQEKK